MTSPQNISYDYCLSHAVEALDEGKAQTFWCWFGLTALCLVKERW